MVSNTPAAQNGSSLAFPHAPVPPFDPDDIPNLTDDQLREVANGGHRRLTGALRNAIKEHARVAGAALLELKGRRRHGDWQAWLRENFVGSEATARAYMRVARNWAWVVEQGLDRADFSLADLQRILGDAPSQVAVPYAPAGDGAGQGGSAPAEANIRGVVVPPTGSPRPEVRGVHLYLDEARKEDFDGHVRFLMTAFGLDNPSDTVFRTVADRRDQEEGRTRG